MKKNINPFNSSSFGSSSVSNAPLKGLKIQNANSRDARMFRLEHSVEHSPFPLKECGQPLPEYSDLGTWTYPNLAVPLGESKKITPEAFLERFWEGVSIAAPYSTPEDLRDAWECKKMLQKLQDAENNAAIARHFWEEIAGDAKAYREFAGLFEIREDMHQFHFKKYYSLEVLPEFSAVLQAKQAVQAYQAALPELLAAPEAEAELFAEISEFSQEMFDTEMLDDFDKLMPAYIRLPDRPNPYKSIITHYYSPNRPLYTRGYTIGPEAGGGDSGGSGNFGGWDGGGDDSGWGDGDGTGDGDDWGSGDFFLVILLGSGVIVIGRVIGRVIVDYGYKILASGIEKYLQVTQKELDQLQAEEPAASAGIEPRQRARGALAAALVPVLFSGSALAVLSYVLHPERLRELVELLADAIVILAHELGRVMLELIPPQLHELAQRVGHAIELIGAYARLLVEQVVIPVLLYARTAAIWFLSAFLVFKLVSLGAEIYQVLAASGVANFKVPPEVTAKALEMADCIGAITVEDSPALFLSQFFKAISLLVLGLVPAPEFDPKMIPPQLGKLFQLSALISIYGVVLQDTRHISQLAGWALQASPEFCSMMSCIAGRWCLIIITVNLARRESALQNYSLPFYCLLYFLRVYQLAFSASPNFLPAF